jgi:hypothetical protein
MPFMSIAAPDVAVRQIPGERFVAPALGLGRHDVEMREQQQRIAARSVAVDARHDGTAAGERLYDR